MLKSDTIDIKTQSGDLAFISRVIKKSLWAINTISAKKLDFNGNYLPDSAIDFAGYEYTITYPRYKGIAALPTVDVVMNNYKINTVTSTMVLL